MEVLNENDSNCLNIELDEAKNGIELNSDEIEVLIEGDATTCDMAIK